MRPLLTLPAAALLAIGLTSCAAGSLRTVVVPANQPANQPASQPADRPANQPAARVAAVPSTSPAVAEVTAGASPASPFPFATPEAAMRYLSDAYNRGDVAGLRKVSTPLAREALQEMRAEAVNLRLSGCTRQPAGDYLCDVVHDYPASLPMDQREGATGHAVLRVAPATGPGWYLTVLETCG